MFGLRGRAPASPPDMLSYSNWMGYYMASTQSPRAGPRRLSKGVSAKKLVIKI
jgi:hypothetical protein